MHKKPTIIQNGLSKVDGNCEHNEAHETLIQLNINTTNVLTLKCHVHSPEYEISH